MIARIFYAIPWSFMLGQLPGLYAGILTITFLIFKDFSILKDPTRLLNIVFSGLALSIISAFIFSIFIRHDPYQANLNLSNRRLWITFPAALFGFIGSYIYAVEGTDLILIIYQKGDITRSLTILYEHKFYAIIAFLISIFLGWLARTPKFLQVFGLRTITLIDFYREKYPHHDEESIIDLSLEQHGRLHSESAKWWCFRGEALRAKQEWQEAMRLGRMSEEDSIICAGFYLALGLTNDAINILKQQINHYPNDVELRYAYCDILEEIGRLGEAEAEYKELMNIDSKFPKGYHAYGNLLHSLGRDEEALDNYNNAIMFTSYEDPEIVAYLNSRGALYAQSGKHDKAEADFKLGYNISEKIFFQKGVKSRGTKDIVENLGRLRGLLMRKK